MSDKVGETREKVGPGTRVTHWFYGKDPKLHGTVLSIHERQELRYDRTGKYHCNWTTIRRAKVQWDNGKESLIVVQNLVVLAE